MTIDLALFTSILYTLVAVMLIVVLYHVLFIVVDLRKIVRRFEDITAQVEEVIMKPLSMADQAVQWVVEFIQEKAHDHKNKHKHKKAIDVEEEEMEDAS